MQRGSLRLAQASYGLCAAHVIIIIRPRRQFRFHRRGLSARPQQMMRVIIMLAWPTLLGDNNERRHGNDNAGRVGDNCGGCRFRTGKGADRSFRRQDAVDGRRLIRRCRRYGGRRGGRQRPLVQEERKRRRRRGARQQFDVSIFVDVVVVEVAGDDF